MKSFIEAKNK